MSDTILTLQHSITIRKWRPTDAEALSHHGNNRKIWQNMTDRFPHPYTLEDAHWWINHNNQSAQHLSTIPPTAMYPTETKAAFEARRAESTLPSSYAICHQDKVIGSCGLEADVRAPRMLELGYWLGEEFWGRGIATQVATRFTQWAFEVFPWVVRVEGDAYSWNGGSQRVLRKSGFEFEGVSRMKAWKEGKFGDVVNFGMVRPDFDGEIMRTEEP